MENPLEDKVFDLKEVQTKLREIAAENPGERAERFRRAEGSPGCRYVHPETGEPSCVIGVLLDRLGFDREIIKALDSVLPNTSVGTSGGQVVWSHFTQPALKYMGIVQMKQDSWFSWGEAVQRADNQFREGS